MREGLLISFEGVDGCGKSTQLARVADALRAADVSEVLTLREPGGTRLGEHVRELLLDPSTGDIDAAAEALLYAASRAELVATTIEPALTRGAIVLLDRYIDSSLAYQGAGRGLGIERVLEANLLATRGRLPDLTVFVDVPPHVAAQRVARVTEAPDRLEQAGEAFFARVHAAYVELAERFAPRIQRIDGARDVEDVAADVWDIVSRACFDAGIDLGAGAVT